jgi:uncharacterized RDD family membrane protein YckC
MTNPYATPESDLTAPAGNGAAPVYGGFWRRLAAAVIDGLCISPLIALQFFLMAHSRYGMAYSIVPMLAVPLLYNVYLVKRYGATPGKLAMKLRITMLDGSPVTGRAALVRYLPWVVFGALQSVGAALAALSMTDEAYATYGWAERSAQLELVQPLWATYAGHMMKAWTLAMVISLLATSKRRTLHDFLAGTVVVRKGA